MGRKNEQVLLHHVFYSVLENLCVTSEVVFLEVKQASDSPGRFVKASIFDHSPEDLTH
jgi:hypothetical protein